MNRYLILIVAVIALISVLVTGFLIIKPNNKMSPAQVTTSITKTAEKNIPLSNVNLTESGFQPQTLTVKTGTRVMWVNNSNKIASVNSDNYPTNLLYPFLNFGQFQNGSSFSTIFSKPGKYTYYNFLNPTQKGTIVVN